MSGTFYWAKIIGKPRPNYARDALEWTFEFEPDENGLKKLKELKLTDRLKDKYEDRGKFLTLKKSELNRDGEPNLPIRIYDAQESPADPKQDKDWDPSKLIGNGSKGNVKLDIRDYGVGKKKGIYPVAVRVTELVEYQSSEFGGMDENEAAAGSSGKASRKSDEEFKKDFGLDDGNELDDDLPM
jgi:hypothetical protein